MPSDGAGLDDEYLEILKEEHTPLEQFWPDEFQRYFDLFVKYHSRKPFHVRRSYGDGFICQKGRTKGGEPYFKGCYPELIAKMLDYERWKRVQYAKQGERRYPSDFWIALNTGRKSTLNAIDLDNKDNVLGYYRESPLADSRSRPLVIMTLAHFQAIKRVYDAFPNRIWCISSLTLGLHIWEMVRFPRPVEMIHAGIKPKLKAIGLGDTEVHPMFGRPFRRPFGKDYFTITNTGLLEDWIEQLNYFDTVGETPTFDAIYHALRSQLQDGWATYRDGGCGTFQGYPKHPHLRDYFIGKNWVHSKHLDAELKLCDLWAERGFPAEMLSQTTVAVGNMPTRVAVGKVPTSAHVVEKTAVASLAATNPPACEITLSQVCNSEWVQNCEKWAVEGLPCHDSILLVVSQLARWFFFIELWDTPEDDRLEKIIILLTDYCLLKNNGYISRLEAGLKADVSRHVGRIIKKAIAETDNSGKLFFSNVRQKRKAHAYRKIIYLESVLLKDAGKCHAEKDNTLSLPVGFTICCTVSPPLQNPQEKRQAAENWEYEPDDTPLPEELEKKIRDYYRSQNVKIYQPTIKSLTRLINHLWLIRINLQYSNGRTDLAPSAGCLPCRSAFCR